MNSASWLLILMNALIWVPLFALYQMFRSTPLPPRDRDPTQRR
ncbi:hypothetical protein [Deinococcus cellulosilyticus]|uniref:Uncharacterized protein n=1 Tax=Deinococcus cellulosilyticus (strain DSM 18568 / NBRC 106333 / KACC 11606 / 5516J-15) TaxID=1223518 RepID=A0A511MZH5_DEIC1|nr:hypothetical protein [Deinococcus cellulosilyticus]GEM45942.1 hypothetical protein DC3_15770 [Deinococcus cellulosilyticus NBRC 106333 = KACC 11606]